MIMMFKRSDGAPKVLVDVMDEKHDSFADLLEVATFVMAMVGESLSCVAETGVE
jgi:hypothetical protein